MTLTILILGILLAAALVALVALFVEHAQHERLLLEISKLKQENRRLQLEIDAWKLKDQHSNELIERYT